MDLVGQLAETYAQHILAVVIAVLLVAGTSYVIALIRCDRARVPEVLRSLTTLIKIILRR